MQDRINRADFDANGVVTRDLCEEITITKLMEQPRAR